MPRLHDNRRARTLAWTTVAALAGGALGWCLGPSRSAPPTPVAHTAPAKPAPITSAKSKSDQPYDLRRFKNPLLQDFVDFDAWLAGATCEQVWSLLDSKNRPREVEYSRLLHRMLSQRFRAFPPAERLAVVRAHAEPGKNSLPVNDSILIDLMADLLPAQPAEVAALSKFIHDPQGHRMYMTLEAWAKTDFEAALAFARSLGTPEAHYFALLVRHLAATDLPSAQRQVEALPSGAERDEAMVNVASVLATTDLAEALKWVIAQGGGTDRIGDSGQPPATELLTRMAHVDPAAVADTILQHPALFEGPGALTAIGDIFGRWAEKDLDAAAAWLKAHPLPATHQADAETSLFAQRMVDLPDTALIDAWRSQSEAVQNFTLRNVAARLAEGDPATILDRVAAAFPDDKRAEAIRWALHQVPTEPPDQILRWLPDLVPSFVNNTAYDHLLASLPADQLATAMGQLPEADRHAIQERTAKGLIREDPDRALEALPPIDPDKRNPFLYSHLATELLRNDPTKAADWVAGFDEGTSKEWAAQNLAASWGKFDPDAATAWVEKLPPGPSRDRASIELAFLHGLTGDYASGFSLAASVQDPQRRLEAAGFALQRLWRRHPDAATASAATLGLPPEQLQSLQTRLAKGEFNR